MSPQHLKRVSPLRKMQGAGVAEEPFHILNIRFVGLGSSV
jgi:hypothetical protein